MAHLTRRHFLGTTAFAAASSCALSALAEPVELGQAAQSSFPKPGMRLVWFGGAASMAGERSQIEPDETGDWVNRQTGQRYHSYEAPGPAGGGFSVMDVLFADANGFLLFLTGFLIHVDAGNATTPTDANGMLAGPEAIADFWMSPARLARFTDQNSGSLRVLHAPYELGGHRFRTVRLQNQSGDGWSQQTYDLDSGLNLVSSSTIQGAAVQGLNPTGQIVPGEVSTMLTHSQIAGVRQTRLPGPGTSYPPEMRQLRRIAFAGTRGVVMAGSPAGNQLPPAPIESRYDIVSNPGPYLTAQLTISGMPNINGPIERVIPAGLVGSLWMSPDYLQRVGIQTIDLDPLTRVETISMGEQNGLAVLGHRSELAQQILGYDLHTGLLQTVELRTQIGPATEILSVRLTGTG